jgi:hypothetical protein
LHHAIPPSVLGTVERAPDSSQLLAGRIGETACACDAELLDSAPHRAPGRVPHRAPGRTRLARQRRGETRPSVTGEQGTAPELIRAGTLARQAETGELVTGAGLMDWRREWVVEPGYRNGEHLDHRTFISG